MAIGGYGALAVAKYHERAEYHLSQARALTSVLVKTDALPDNGTALDQFRQTHYGRYPHLSRIRLNWLWVGLHLGVMLYGFVLLMITVAV